jgi:hypothetical protein
MFEALKGNLKSFAALCPRAFALKKLPGAMNENEINSGEQFVTDGIRRAVNGMWELGGKNPELPEKDI